MSFGGILTLSLLLLIGQAADILEKLLFGLQVSISYHREDVRG